VPIPGLKKQSVRGKVALVTGASRGIGAAIATELANRGARVALLGRDAAALATVTGSLSKLSGDHAWFVADVTSDESMERAVAEVVAHFGGVDIVVANAGIVSYGTVFLCETSDFARVVDTNITGTYRTVRSCLPALQASRGYVLIMGSISSFSSLGGLGSYTASKAGVEALAHALYMELDHAGIGVGMIYPSWVDTEMIANAEEAMPSFKQVRRAWAKPASLPGLAKWPGGTATPEQCAHTAVNTIERRGRRSWVPLPLWALSFSRVVVNSMPGERVQIRLFDRAIRQVDQELTRNGAPRQPH